jgi:hypothetical protein
MRSGLWTKTIDEVKIFFHQQIVDIDTPSCLSGGNAKRP